MTKIGKRNRLIVIIGGGLIIVGLIAITIMDTSITAYTVPGILSIGGGVMAFIKVKK